MEKSKIKIEIEIDIEQYVEGVRVSMTKDDGLDFEKALEGKKDKRGVLDRMLDWVNGR